MQVSPFQTSHAAPTLRTRFRTCAEFAATPPPTWLVRDLIPAMSLGMLFGPSNGGKSFFGLDVCLRLSWGLPVCARNVEKRRVILVPAEGQPGAALRIKTWRLAHDLDVADCSLLV